MPHYEDQALKAGWEKKGAKWQHPDHPDKVFYNARQIWDLLPENLKRPLSVTPREIPKPVEQPMVIEHPKPDEPVKWGEWKVGEPKKPRASKHG